MSDWEFVYSDKMTRDTEESKRQFVHIARTVLSLVPEGERQEFQTWLLNTMSHEYADAADGLYTILRKWEEIQDKMDVGL